MLNKNWKKKVLFFNFSAVALFILIISFFLILNLFYKNKIMPNVYIGNISLGGLNYEQSEKKIQEILSQFEISGWEFKLDNSTNFITPNIGSNFNPENSRTFISFEIDKTIKQALTIGRDKNLINRIKKQFLLLKNKEHLNFQYDLDEETLSKVISELFINKEKRVEDAHLIITNDFQIKIKPEISGFSINKTEAISTFKENLNKLEIKPINLQLQTDNPKIKKENIEPQITTAQNLINKEKIFLTYQEEEWFIPRTLFKNWIIIEKKDQTFSINFLAEEIDNYINKFLAEKFISEPKNAEFKLENNKVILFSPSITGKKLNTEKIKKDLKEMVISNNQDRIFLETEEFLPEINTSASNDLGIKEIIGIGRSNFRGSPNNRVHNIKTGAKQLQGMLIKPNEEFSLVTAIGKVDAESGYREELVIKGDKTVPEFGGGLCQIGTTIFRTALESGLPVTERRNHSYRIGYYEPAGTDATIYMPKPDLKFINDTNNYILVQSKIIGTELLFEFWGTKDGRIAEKTTPKIFNLKDPPLTKIIETKELAPGEKKCTEKPHQGADAVFNYKVTYADGLIKEQEFKSHYIPWQEVCLVGIDPNQNGNGVNLDIIFPPNIEPILEIPQN